MTAPTSGFGLLTALQGKLAADDANPSSFSELRSGVGVQS